MPVSLLIAILVATGFAVFGFPFRFYRFWYSWNRVKANAGVLLYLVLAGGGGGLIGWLIAYLAQVPPSPNEAIDGFFYGVAGALTVRADFRGQGSRSSPGASGRAPRDAQAGRAPREVQTAASLLGKGIEWCTAMLDDLATEAAKRWLIEQDDFTLLRVSNDCIHEIKNRSDLPSRTRTTMIRGEAEAMKKLAVGSTADEEQRATARGQLVYFCLYYMMGANHLKPAYPQSAPAQPTSKTRR